MTASTLRVLHLTLSIARGGRRQAITSLVQGLPGAGVRPYLGCLNELGCSQEETADFGPGILVLGRTSLLDWNALRRLRRFCADNGVQVVHAHDAASQFTAALLRLSLPGLRLLMTFHRSLDFESARPMDRVRNAFADAMSHAVVTLSRERREHYLRNHTISKRKVILLPNGVDDTRFRPDAAARARVREEAGLDDGTLLFGAVGHFGPEKGVDVVLRSWREFQARREDLRARLMILGEGSDAEKARISNLAAACRPGSVMLMGFRADTERYYSAFDVYVHAPRSENFPFAVLEAMATGLPVVGTAVGGLKDSIRGNGILVPPDSPVELADAMEAVLNPALRAAFGAESLRLVRSQYNRVIYIERHAMLYRALLGNRFRKSRPPFQEALNQAGTSGAAAPG